ncbi:hypothetical protein TEHD10_1975 [Tetragenococcus halophilus subsp. halophilus]|nr:hypothetical protein TEHD10_1975 [Tetragenococcus halophilus subsp. halophilus]
MHPLKKILRKTEQRYAKVVLLYGCYLWLFQKSFVVDIAKEKAVSLLQIERHDFENG